MSRCAKEFGWHVTLLRMITGPFGAPRSISDSKEHDISVLEEKKRGEEDLIDTVLEIVFRVMWKGVEGFGESDWKVKTYLLKYCFCIDVMRTYSRICTHAHFHACGDSSSKLKSSQTKPKWRFGMLNSK